MSFEWIDPFAEAEQQRRDARNYVADQIERLVGPDYDRVFRDEAMHRALRDAQRCVSGLGISKLAQEIIERHMETAVRAALDLTIFNTQPAVRVYVDDDGFHFVGTQEIRR